jgi:hypothetical protein
VKVPGNEDNLSPSSNDGAIPAVPMYLHGVALNKLCRGKLALLSRTNCSRLITVSLPEVSFALVLLHITHQVYILIANAFSRASAAHLSSRHVPKTVPPQESTSIIHS